MRIKRRNLLNPLPELVHTRPPRKNGMRRQREGVSRSAAEFGAPVKPRFIRHVSRKRRSVWKERSGITIRCRRKA
jgi:hypothetical protein